MAKPKLALIPAAQGSKFYSVLPSSGVGDFTFTRSGSATRINSQGLIETVGNGVSRLNYPLIDGKVVGCPSHLLEPQRSNLIFYSENFNNAFWTRSNATVISNNVISPDGTLNASSVAFTAGGYLLESVTTTKTIGSSETISVFSKTDISGTFLKYGGGTASGTDLENKESFGNGWYRYSVTRTFTEAETASTQIIISSTEVGLNVVLFGAQLEQGSFPTSYIPTNGSAVTRSAETANGSGDANTFNDSEGVLYVETKGLSDLPSISRYISLSRDGESSFYDNMLMIQHRADGNLRVYANGSATANIHFNIDIDFAENHKIAVLYKLNGYKLFVDGVEQSLSGTPVQTVFSGLDNLSFNLRTTGNWNGSIRDLRVYNTELTDTELQALTSWVSFSDMANGQLYTIQ